MRLENPPPRMVLVRRSGIWSAALAAMPGLPRRKVDCTLPSRLSRMRAGFTPVAAAGVSGRAEPLAFQSPKAALASFMASASVMRPVTTSSARSGRKRFACSARSIAALTALIDSTVGSVRPYGWSAYTAFLIARSARKVGWVSDTRSDCSALALASATSFSGKDGWRAISAIRFSMAGACEARALADRMMPSAAGLAATSPPMPWAASAMARESRLAVPSLSMPASMAAKPLWLGASAAKPAPRSAST